MSELPLSPDQLTDEPCLVLADVGDVVALPPRAVDGPGDSAAQPVDDITVSVGELSAIISAGRSGSTWLGSIIDTLPTVAYRFEPFHRDGAHTEAVRQIETRLNGGLVDVSDREALYEALLPAELITEKPPFFPKQWWRHGRHGLWAASRALPRGERIYERFKRAVPPGTPVVFKEISFERHIGALLNNLQMPVVYLVRHPCGTVLSDYRGQQTGAMPTGRQGILRRYLTEMNAVGLLDEFGDRLDEMNDLERSAVLWRCDSEMALAAIDAAEGTTGRARSGHVVIYEELCDDPVGQTRKVLDYLDLEMAPATHSFIEQLASGKRAPLLRRDAYDKFFTVFRDPAEQRDQWMADITNEERRTIEAIVQPSWVYERFAATGVWV